MKKVFLITIALLLLGTGFAQEQQPKDILAKIEASDTFAPLFPFQPTHAAPSNITNVSTWNGAAIVPAGASGFISADADHFKDEKGNERRFIGTNICFTGCFPEKEEADRVADELTRYGINVVRLHYVHHVMPKGKSYPEKDSFLDPDFLEKFDYLFAALKKKGIYCYFQLNIARKFGKDNGFENADRLPVYNNGIDNINTRMIFLHKKYVGDILGHVNPYTGLAYKDEPAISMLEITNENSFQFAWFDPKYKFPYLTEPYASEVKEIWNDWLIQKYGDTKTLKEAWMQGVTGSGEQFLPDGKFTSDAANTWNLQKDNVAVADWEVVPASGKDRLKGKYYARIKVEKTGAAKTMPQFCRRGLHFDDGAPYCLKLRIRTSEPGNVSIRCSQSNSPWGIAGLNTTVKIDQNWKDFTFNFCSSLTDDDIRVVIGTFTPGVIDIADVSLVSGMDYKWPAESTLEAGTVDWPGASGWSTLKQRANDFTEFMAYIERLYLSGMYSHIKSNVQAKQPVTGTQLSYSFSINEAGMDYCDMHRYWCHPNFPGKSWSRTNWNLANKSLANGDECPGSCLTELSRTRLLGKPVTISEHDHPHLNFYEAEGDLMAAAMGAFQNWSALIQFSWTHSRDFFRSVESGQFDLCSATEKLVHFPACWAMFVRKDVSPGRDDIVYAPTWSEQKEIEMMAKTQKSFSIVKESNPMLAAVPLAMVTGRALEEEPALVSPKYRTVIRDAAELPEEYKRAYENKEITSNSGEITWNWQEKGAGWFRVDTRNTKVFSGFISGRSFDFKGMTISPGKTRLNWATISLTNTTPDGSGRKAEDRLAPGRYLLAATGMCHNTDAVIVDLGGGRISCAPDNGGDLGKAPVLCEGIDASFKLKGLSGKVQCWALDPDGNRSSQVKVEADPEGNAILKIGHQYQTVWYEVNIQ